jgi:anti-sigma factor RsiW
MTHDQVQLLLSDYLEENLREDDLQGVQAHLSSCETCRNDLDLLRRALKLVQEMPPVEAPPDFPLRLRRRARKSGLFDSRRRRFHYRMMVPFESAMVVLLATVGALIFTLLLFQSQLHPVIVQQEPAVILVGDTLQVNSVARVTWQVGGEVHALGKPVPEGSPLGAPYELDLYVPPGNWNLFRSELDRILPGNGLPAGAPASDSRGFVRIVVQIRLNSRETP